LGDEAIGCIDDCPFPPSLDDRHRQPQLCASPLMAIEGASVKVSFAIKGEETASHPNDADWLSVLKLYADVGHAHPSAGKAGQAATCRIPEHLPELGAR
jgi:hypothetical protein